jgi:SagB-type dehydrogenase family enzyme
MDTRTVRYVLNLLLLVAVAVSLVTGFVVDRLGLHGFSLHRWAGYLVAALAAVHIARHWRWFLPRRGAAPTPEGAQEPHAVPSPVPVSAKTGSAASPSRRAALVAAGAGVAGAVVGWGARTALSPAPYPGGDVGLFYHRESSLGLRTLLGDLLDWGSRPSQYKAVSIAAPLPLPPVSAPPQMTFDTALRQRRSLRAYADRGLTTQELAWIVASATAITSTDGRRVAPSAGALYPLETYVAVNRVDGIDAGLYHVDVRGQALEPLRAGSVAGDLLVAGLGQSFLREAPVVVIVSGLFQRTRWKYRQRHYRYVCWEGGHVAQNVYLAAEAAGLGACMVGSFLDGSVNDLLRVDGREEAALGLIAVGAR